MKFQEAKDKLKELAKGKYHCIEYKLTEYSDTCGNTLDPVCTVYIDGFNHHKGKTWEEALTSIDRAMNGTTVNPEEAPDAETVEIIDGPRPCLGAFGSESILCGCYEEA